MTLMQGAAVHCALPCRIASGGGGEVHAGCKHCLPDCVGEVDLSQAAESGCAAAKASA